MKCPKAVLAAIAVSYAHINLDHDAGELFDEETITKKLHEEWTALYASGIVPQKPIKLKIANP